MLHELSNHSDNINDYNNLFCTNLIDNKTITSKKDSVCCYWWFFHSSYGLPVVYDSKNTYCLCLNCCPGCLEIKYKSNINAIYLCCCFSIICFN